MKLLSALEMITVKQSSDLQTKFPVIALIGGGGKTSSMFRLGQELDETTLLTTTTQMFFPKNLFRRGQLDGLVLARKFSTLQRGIIKFSGKRLFACSNILNSKAKGISPKWINELASNEGDKDENNMQIVVEADGAARMPAKFHSRGEPVIPSSSNMVLLVIGSDAMGMPVDQAVHRSELAVKEFNWDLQREHQYVNGDMMYQLLKRAAYLANEQAPKAKLVVLINKVDSLEQERLEEINTLGRNLLAENLINGVLMTSMREMEPVRDSY